MYVSTAIVYANCSHSQNSARTNFIYKSDLSYNGFISKPPLLLASTPFCFTPCVDLRPGQGRPLTCVERDRDPGDEDARV